MTQTILVLGRHGQLACELEKLGPPKGFEFAFAGRADFDLLAEADPKPLIEACRPVAVINAAAYTAVDRAESEPEAAFLLNRDVPAALARACQSQGIPLSHFSTDYVFDGTKPSPYVEEDPIAPLGIYGQSKAEGEQAVLESCSRAAVVRTSWVFSSFGSNFVKTMLGLAGRWEEVSVVADQLGRPTWAKDLARGALRLTQALLDREASSAGLFHLSGAGDANWADFAEAIFEMSAARGGAAARVKRIASAEYPTAARRPANSRLDSGKIMRVLGVGPRDWREGLGMCLDEVKAVSR